MVGFARRAKCGDKRIRQYYDTWQYAASKGLVPDATTLTPADAHKVPYPTENGAEVSWKQMYNYVGGAGSRASDAASKQLREQQAKAAAQAQPTSETPAANEKPAEPTPEPKVAQQPVADETPAPATQPEQARQPSPAFPPKLKQYTLTWTLQEKVAAVAAEQGVPESHVVREAVRNWLKQEVPPRLEDKYGTTKHELQPEDVLKRAGIHVTANAQPPV